MPTVLAKYGYKAKREILTITISDFYVQIYKKATQETLKGGLQYF
jgi:hypothetical protein